MSRLKQAVGFINRHDIRQADRFGRFDQINILPGFTQDMPIEKLKPVQIQLDRAPGMGAEQLGEIIQQLLFWKIMNPVVEVRGNTPNGSGIGFYTHHE